MKKKNTCLQFPYYYLYIIIGGNWISSVLNVDRQLLMLSIMGIQKFTIFSRHVEPKYRYSPINFFLLCDWNFQACLLVDADSPIFFLCFYFLESQEDTNDCCKSSRSSRVWAQSVRASSSKEWWYLKGCPLSLLFIDSCSSGSNGMSCL